MALKIDHAAKEIALRRHVLPECLHIPVGAVDEAAIGDYIGTVDRVISRGNPNKALLVRIAEQPPIDARLPISKVKGAAILHQRDQVWVHIAYTRYRRAYVSAFPKEDITGKILSHATNRRVAALMGYQYVRITPVSRATNSSSGALSEQWGVELHSTPAQQAANRRRGAFIRYADLADLMVMLDMKVGGGVMQAVNEGQALVTPDRIP